MYPPGDASTNPSVYEGKSWRNWLSSGSVSGIGTNFTLSGWRPSPTWWLLSLEGIADCCSWKAPNRKVTRLPKSWSVLCTSFFSLHSCGSCWNRREGGEKKGGGGGLWTFQGFSLLLGVRDCWKSFHLLSRLGLFRGCGLIYCLIKSSCFVLLLCMGFFASTQWRPSLVHWSNLY